MKHASEWGNGRPIVRKRRYRPAKSGRSGTVLSDTEGRSDYCLKIVSLLKKNGKLNDMFWSEARSVSVYTSVARNIPGCAVCPLPPSYWIWEEDPLYVNFPRARMSEERPRALIDYISLLGVSPDQLKEEFGINDPATYWFAPSPLLKQIRDEKRSARLLMTYPVLEGLSNLSEIIKCTGELGRSLPGKHRRGYWDPVSQGWVRSRKGHPRALVRFWDPVKQAWLNSVWDPPEVRKIIGNILVAILELYRNGLAHGDVKPGNIMFGWGGYFLTDVGSIHSGSRPSDSGTQVFFSTNTFKIWEAELKSGKLTFREQNEKLMGNSGHPPDTELTEEQLNGLLRRTLMDGYALAVTIWSMAYGREPESSLLNLDWVNDRWHCDEITDIFHTLFEAETLTIAKMQTILAQLKDESPPRFGRDPIVTYGRESEIGFDVECRETVGDMMEVQYGKLSEQLNFSGKFNPMLRFYGEQRGWRSDFPPEAVMQPIIETRSNGGSFVNNIYYAPDDAESGCRPVDFENYHSCTLTRLLDSGRLTEEDIAELLALGHRIDKYLAEKKEKRWRWGAVGQHLPYPDDIVKVDGKWVILPFFLKGLFLYEEISFEEYFKMLCGRGNKLTPQNWANLLDFDLGVGILFELLPENMVHPLVELLNASAKIKLVSVEEECKIDRIDLNQRLRKKLRKTKKFGKYLSAE